MQMTEGGSWDIIQNLKTDGNNCYKESAFTDAIERYGNALELLLRYKENNSGCNELHAQILCNRALCSMRLGNFEKAIEDCSETLTIQPNSVKAFYRRAKCYEITGKLELACRDIRRAKVLNPKNSEINKLYRKLYACKKTEDVRASPASKARLLTVLRRCLKQVKPSCLAALSTVHKVKAVELDGEVPYPNTAQKDGGDQRGVAPQISLNSVKISKVVQNLMEKQESVIEIITDMTEGLSCLPIKFENIEQQINFYAVKALCNFENEFITRHIEKLLKRPYSDIHMQGIISLHLKTNSLTGKSQRGWDAQFLSNINANELSSCFNIPLTSEEEIKTGIYVGKDTIFKPFLKKLVATLNLCAKVLKEHDFVDFAEYILRLYKTYSDTSVQWTFSEYLIQNLAQTFPSFCDQELLTSRQGRSQIKVGFYSNAQYFTRDLLLNIRLLGENIAVEIDRAAQMNIELSSLTSMANRRTIFNLKKLGVLEIFDSEILSDFEVWHTVNNRSHILLKAACVIAIDDIAGKLRLGDFERLSAWQLDLLFGNINQVDKLF